MLDRSGSPSLPARALRRTRSLPGRIRAERRPSERAGSVRERTGRAGGLLPRLARRMRPSRRTARIGGVVAVALLGAWLGLMIGGRDSTPIGPVDTHMSAKLSWSGDTVVRVGPLGTMAFDTHDGPIGVSVTVDQLNVADTRQLFENPAALDGLESWVTEDAREAIIRLVVRSVLSAIAGAVILATLVYRRRARRVTLAAGTVTAVVIGTMAGAAATWNPRSIYEPRYTGLLVSAPSVVGNAKSIVEGFSNYSEELANLVTNVSKLYDVTSSLPAYEPDPTTIRVLHVADIHLNPASWDVIKTLSEQFQVQVIVDSGDITDHGLRAERRFVNSIADLKLPYVWVRGNHDSLTIQEAVDAQPNAVVLDRGAVADVAGLRFIGDGDPRFTPDRSEEPLNEAGVAVAGRALAAAAQRTTPPPNVAVVHDPAQGVPLDGSVPLVLAGHAHNRSTELMENGTRMFVQGSTGGAGLRALEGETPIAVQATVFYFDSETKRLQAWDDVDIGGLGLHSVQVSRTIAPEEKARVGAEPGRAGDRDEQPQAAVADGERRDRES